MIVIGCTGGIGSGKSTVSALLKDKGALVIDADEIARRALDRDGVAYDGVRARFGAGVVREDATFDRAALAEIVFREERARRDLEALIHPVVESEIKARLAARAADQVITVLDVALLIETNGRERYGLDGVLVVDAPEELQIERLIADRHYGEGEARARVEAQLDRGARLCAADFVSVNVGTLAELELMTDNAWRWMSGLLHDERETNAR
jgi:dephospho-CoA kinase